VIALVGFSGPDVRASESFCSDQILSICRLEHGVNAQIVAAALCTKQKKLSKQIPADAATAFDRSS
jgi:hypothetical protein